MVIGFEQSSYETTETDATSALEIVVLVHRGGLRRNIVVTLSTDSEDRSARGLCACACVCMCV